MSKAHDERRESDSTAARNYCRDIGIWRSSDDDTTRHEYKGIAEEQGLFTSHEKAGLIPHTNEKTQKKDFQVVKDFRKYCRTHGYGENLRTVSPQAAQAFFDYKVLECGVSRSRISDITSIISKCGQFAERAGFANGHGLTDTAQAYKQDVIKEIPRLPLVSRAFENPAAVIQRLTPAHQLAAEIQLRTGFRAENACAFKINADSSISFVSKGGQPHEHFSIPADLLERSKEFADASGNVLISTYQSYAWDVRKAAQALGERINLGPGKTKLLNTHAFRHCFGRSMYNDLVSRGVSVTSAKAQVSEALFHKRLEIVNIYIR